MFYYSIYLNIPCQKSCQKYGGLLPKDYNSVMRLVY